jgi:hypothetical protein
MCLPAWIVGEIPLIYNACFGARLGNPRLRKRLEPPERGLWWDGGSAHRGGCKGSQRTRRERSGSRRATQAWRDRRAGVMRELAPAFKADKSGGKPPHSKGPIAGSQLTALGDGLRTHDVAFTPKCLELAPAFRADKSGGKPEHSKERIAGRQLTARRRAGTRSARVSRPRRRARPSGLRPSSRASARSNF